MSTPGSCSIDNSPRSRRVAPAPDDSAALDKGITGGDSAPQRKADGSQQGVKLLQHWLQLQRGGSLRSDDDSHARSTPSSSVLAAQIYLGRTPSRAASIDRAFNLETSESPRSGIGEPQQRSQDLWQY